MHFRPCIDIHNGKVKQIVGGSLTDQGNQAKENFTASENADYYAKMYQKDGNITQALEDLEIKNRINIRLIDSSKA